MSYNVLIDETYVNNPNGVIHLNYRLTRSCETLDDVLLCIAETSKRIRKENNVIKEWSESRKEVVIHKILHTRKYGKGRLLTSFKIGKAARIVYNDSLI